MAVFIKKVNIPQKSDLINIDIIGSSTPRTFRVLKNVGGSVVEVMGLAQSGSEFSQSSQVYENSLLDTYLNTTMYNTFSNEAKLAIVDKAFRQECWNRGNSGNPVYAGKQLAGNYQVSLVNASFGNEITRHCWAMGIQDIIDYLEVTPQMTYENTTLTAQNMQVLFSNSDMFWLNTAPSEYNDRMFSINASYGNIGYGMLSDYKLIYFVCQIDLSKIDYTFTDGRQPVELKPVSILQKSNNALSRVGMSYKEPRVADLTGTTWQFNDDITSSPMAGPQSINGTMYFTRVGYSEQSSQYVYQIFYNSSGYTDFIVFYRDATNNYPYVQYYPSNGWQLREGSDVRTNITTPTISITGGQQVTMPDLINWFYTNATRIS